MDANVGLTYVIKKLANLALSVDYTYERLANLELTDEIFHENHLIFRPMKYLRFPGRISCSCRHSPIFLLAPNLNQAREMTTAHSSGTLLTGHQKSR